LCEREGQGLVAIGIIAALMIQGLAALASVIRNPNRWQDLFFSAILDSLLFLVTVYWFIHIRFVIRRWAHHEKNNQK
jgi:Kef-type K+ transport system membrane component KefB